MQIGQPSRRSLTVVRLFHLISAVVAAATLKAQDPALTRGPFLQLPGPHSILIAWKTSEPADSTVEYGLDESYGRKVSNTGAATSHAVAVSGLEPKTRYRYRILAKEKVLAEGFQFSTNPEAGSPSAAFRFAAVGDTGLVNAAQKNVIERIALAGVDFAIHIGDLTYPGGQPTDLDVKYFQPFRGLISNLAVYIALGNKEVEFDGGAGYLEAFHFPENGRDPERYYSFEHGNALIIALDSNQSLAAGEAQYEWAMAQLQSAKQIWKIVFFHHPIYSSLRSEATRQHLEPLFNQFKVDLVFQGHTHYYERTFPLSGGGRTDASEEPDYIDPAGTVYVVTGGGGGTLAAATPKAFSAFYRSTFHFVRMEIDGWNLKLETIDADGQLFDRMTIAKTPPVSEPVFRRADTDADGAVNLTDPVVLLGYLFLGSKVPDCLDAADADDSGDLSLTDAIYSLSWQFLGGPEPPAPGPKSCGRDVTAADPPFAPCIYAPGVCP